MSGGFDYDYESDDARVPEPGTGRKSGARKIGSVLTGLFAIFLFVAFTVAAGLAYIKTSFEAAGPLQADKAVVVNPGEGSRAIAQSLYQVQAISNQKLFLVGLLFHRANDKLKAGEYLIEANASMQQIMDKLVSGKSLQYKVTIPEGLTTRQAIDRLHAHEILVGKIGTDVPEGSLLPDTYNFTRGTTRQEVVERMQNAQTKLLARLWSERTGSLPLASPREAVILASIVEKETGLKSERQRVAGVFVNRLKQNMRLQSDPTIVYGIVGGVGTLGRPILRSDISKKTEYNTYQIDGLPPTPIANPGKAAIEAVLNPAETKDLFFVADGTGGHAFAETLAEHNKNVSRWRALERRKNQTQAANDVLAPTEVPDTDEPEQTAALQPGTEPATQPSVPVTDQDTAAATQDGTTEPAPSATAPSTEQAKDIQTDGAEKPEISATAKAIIKKAPRPQRKPPAPPRQAATQSDPAPGTADQSQVTVEPLPDTPSPEPTEPQQEPAPARQTPSTSDLR